MGMRFPSSFPGMVFATRGLGDKINAVGGKHDVQAGVGHDVLFGEGGHAEGGSDTVQSAVSRQRCAG
jgi:hypothetical protein